MVGFLLSSSSVVFLLFSSLGVRNRISGVGCVALAEEGCLVEEVVFLEQGVAGFAVGFCSGSS